MNKVLEWCRDLPVKSLGTGEAIMHEGEEGRKLAILKEGEVEVVILAFSLFVIFLYRMKVVESEAPETQGTTWQ